MPTIRLREFLGEFPRLDRRNLPPGGAQTALNVRFDSGDLRPIARPLDDVALVAGDIGNLFWYRHQDDDTGRYIAFGTNLRVDGFRSTVPDDSFRRWYWCVSGDGIYFIANPKNPTPAGVSLSVGGGGDFRQFQGVPVGVPAPKTEPEVTDATPEAAVGVGTGISVVSIAATNPVTFNTGSDHPFEEGWTVRIVVDESLPRPEQPPGDGDGEPPGDPPPPNTDPVVGKIWALSGQTGIVINVDSSQFDISGISALGLGDFAQEDLDAVSVERVVQDSELESRAYLWTYVNQWGEEGPPSLASNIIDVPAQGAVVNIEISDSDHQPTTDGGSREYVNRIRLYRSAAGNTGTTWLFVGELQYSGAALPDDNISISVVQNAIVSVSPSIQRQGLGLSEGLPPEYSVGDEIRILSTDEPDFSVTTTIRALTNININGEPEYIVTELPWDTIDTIDPPSGLYVTKGLGVVAADGITWASAPNAPSPELAFTATIQETVPPISLGEVIPSEGWFPPPSRMQGMTVMPNGIICGWKNNTLYFTDRYLPHAWDPDYKISIADEIVGAQSFGNTLVVGTAGRPYVVTGIDPSNMTAQKLPLWAPLVDPRSICDAGFGVLYISTDGLVLVNGNRAEHVSKQHYTEREWRTAIADRPKIKFYDGLALIFGRGQKPLMMDFNGQNMQLSIADVDIDAADNKDGELAIVAKGPGSEYRKVQQFRNDSSSVLQAQFRSGMVAFRRPVNPACAQVFADDYPVTLILRNIRPSSYPEPTAGQPNTDILEPQIYLVEGEEPFWLKPGFLTREFDLEIFTSHRVQEVVISTSIEELRRV